MSRPIFGVMAEGHQMAVWTPRAAPSAPALPDQFVRQGIEANVPSGIVFGHSRYDASLKDGSILFRASPL
jgi:hypothetical protein